MTQMPTFRPLLFRCIFMLATAAILFSCARAEQQQPRTARVGNVTFQCAPSVITSVDKIYNGKWDFNGQLAAGTYAVYAAASYDAYEPRSNGNSRAFRVDDNAPKLKLNLAYGKTGWILAEPRHAYSSGLSFDVYYHDTPGRLDVMVAFRGTDDGLNRDWIANASWLTQWFNPWDQYRQARNNYVSLMERAIKAANGKPVSFLATGHSLGGGLAQHVAHVHPCTSTVVFNTSFVTNTTIYGSFNPIVIKLYEIGDVFEGLKDKIDNTDMLAIYRLPLTLKNGAIYNHSMEKFAAALLRMAIDCYKNTPRCEISNQQAALANTLFCDRYIKLRYDNGDIDALKMRESPDFCPSHRDMY
jgi:pimeloyl-ACP methyl ester carboxylesterase